MMYYTFFAYAVSAKKRLYGYDDDQLVMIPVKYDLKELRQWTLVLDRFAVSSGNTIGITGAEPHNTG